MPRGQSSQGFTDGTITIGTNVDTAGINSGLARISKTFKRFGALTAGILGIRALARFGKAAIDAASDLQEVQNIVDVTFGDLEWKMEKFADTAVEAFGMSEFTAKQTAGSFMAMGKASGIAAEDAANMALQLTALAGDMASFYNISQNYAKVALSAVYTGETETLKRYGIILTEANLQEYAASKGLNVKVKKLDAASKAMLRYQYILEHTDYIQGDFLRTQDNWANQVRVLQERWRQFLITLGSGFITILNPIVKSLNLILQYVTSWANAMGKVLSKLLGIQWQDFEAETAQLSDATAELSEAEDTLGDSLASTAKKAKKLLQPFDELNVLADKTASSSGGLSEALFSIPEFNTNFDVQGVDTEIEPPDIKNWYEFGKYLSDLVKNFLDNISWDEIKEKLRTLATNIADFVNGLFQPETFASIGKTIAEALNSAFTFAFTLGQGLDFENIGQSFAAAINNFFETFDFAQAANAIDVWVQGLWKALKTAFKGNENGEGGIDWPLVRKKLAEFFSEIDIETVGLVIGYLFIKKINKVALLAAAGKQLAAVLGTALAKAFYNLKLSMFVAQLAKGLGGGTSSAGLVPALEGPVMQAGISLGTILMDGIGIAIAAIGGSIIGANLGGVLEKALGGDGSTYEKYMGLTGFIDMYKDLALAIKDFFNPEIFKQTGIYDFFVNLGDKITEIWTNITTWFSDAGNAIVMMCTDAKNAVINIWNGIVDWFRTTIFEPISNLVTTFFNAWNTVLNWIASVFQSIWVIIKAVWIVVADWFKTNVIDRVVRFFTDAWNLLKTAITTLWEYIKSVWGVVATWFDTYVITPVKNVFNFAVDFLKIIWTNLWEDIKSVWSVVASWFETTILTPLKNNFNFAVDFIKLIWTNLITDIQTAFDTFVTSVSTAIDKIKGFFTSLWDGITSGVKDAINFAIGIIEGFINKVIDAINTFTSGISTIASAASVITGDNYTAIGSIPHVSLPKLAEGAVIPPNREFAAILGDQKHGTNIETPLDTMISAFKTALSSSDSPLTAYLQQQVQLLEVIANKEFGITDNQIFNSVKKSAHQYTLSTGDSAF